MLRIIRGRLCRPPVNDRLFFIDIDDLVIIVLLVVGYCNQT